MLTQYKANSRFWHFLIKCETFVRRLIGTISANVSAVGHDSVLAVLMASNCGAHIEAYFSRSAC